MLKLKLNQSGDTIVEVLIAAAIIGVILISAYATARQSQTNEQRSQERGQATAILQGQLEALRSALQTTPNPYKSDQYASGFCIYNGNFYVTSLSVPAANCELNYGGQPTTNEPQYRIFVTQPSPDSTGGTFEAQVNWDQLGGGTENVTLDYRVYTP